MLNRHGSLIQVGHDDHLSRLTRQKENSESSRIIRINVSGNRYETYVSTLERYPETLLGNKYKRIYYWNEEEKEYFFDRHRVCFQSILYFYQSRGRLRRPDHVPLDTFLEEISFFQLGSEAIEQINKLENLHIVRLHALPKWHWQQRIWFVLEYPQQSNFARIIHLIFLFLTVISSLSLAIETLPEYEDKWNRICQNNANLSYSSLYVPRCAALFSSPFFVIETIAVGFLTIEFLLRCLSTPSCTRLIFSPMIWIGLAAIIPYYIFLSIQLADQQINLNQTIFILLRILRFVRFFRIFQIYLIFEQLKSLRVLGATLKESYVDFLIMVVIITVVAFLFGAAAYYAERSVNSEAFDSIPVSTYWAMVTITSLGLELMLKFFFIGYSIETSLLDMEICLQKHRLVEFYLVYVRCSAQQ